MDKTTLLSYNETLHNKENLQSLVRTNKTFTDIMLSKKKKVGKINV